MNIKAIIGSLVLGSSSVAMASPSVTFSASAQDSHGAAVVLDARTRAPQPTQPVYYRDRDRDRDGNGGWNGGWNAGRTYRPVILASGLHFGNDGRKFITVGSQAGRFQTLKISASAGRTFIQQVYVQFDNGQEQVIRNVDRTLFGNQSLTVDLDGGRRAIKRIVVYSNPVNRWRQSAGTFTVTAA